MIKEISKTDGSWEPLILRLFLGSVILAHGLQKVFGWFGGFGFESTMQYFNNVVDLPNIVALSVILLESLRAILLLIGLGTRLFALAFILLALGIVMTSHLQYGFFMNWSGQQEGEGIEFFLLWIPMSIALLIGGGGRFSLDLVIAGDFIHL